MILIWILSYIQVIDLNWDHWLILYLFRCLDVYAFLCLKYCSKYIIGCLTRNEYFVGFRNNFFPVHWLILFLPKSVYCFFCFEFLKLVCFWLFFKGSDFYEWLWNNFYVISSSLIDSLFALICMLFLLIWIIIASRMLLAVWKEVITFYDCKMMITMYPVHWLILQLLWSGFWFQYLYCYNF